MPVHRSCEAESADAPASILAIGDSWFWYPENNLLGALARHRALKEPYRHFRCLGFSGAAIHEYVDRGRRGTRAARALRRELDPQRSRRYAAVLLGGGGNEALDYGLALQRDCAGLERAEDCIDRDGLDGLMRNLSGALGLLVHDLLWAFARQARPLDIFVHGYDYPVPDGHGCDARTVSGPSLTLAMDRAGVAHDAALRLGIAHRLVDALNETGARFARPGCGVHFVDCRNVLRRDAQYRDDWDYEWHPSREGFRRIAAERWIPLLARLGYAT
jgi:hypothetical protein